MRNGLLLIGFVLFFFSNGLFAQPLSGILPKNGAFIEETQVTMSWNELPNALNYTVEIAQNATFTIGLQQSTLLTLTSWQTPVLSNGVWYWRVIGNNGSQNFNSEVSSFRIFQPNNLIGNTLWLAADSNVALNGGTVTAWNDISGNGHIFGQLTVSDQPIKIANLPVLNNQPVIRFDGTSDFLDGGNILNIGLNSLTTFVLAKGAGMYYAKFGNANAPNNTYSSYVVGGSQGHEIAGLTYNFLSASSISEFHISSFLADRSNNISKMIRNNNIIATGNLSGINSSYNFNTSNPLRLGRYGNNSTPFFLNGDIAEVIFYNVALSDTERQLVENHLMYKYAPPIDLGKDTVLLNLCPYTITPTSGFTNYLWNTGETTASINVSQAGTYWVQGTNLFGVVSRDTVVVYHPTIPPPTFNGICVNESMTWNADMGPGFTYLWSPNGETTPSINITTAGTYSVQVTDALLCTKNSGAYTFGIDTYSQTTFLGNDTTLCSGNLIALQVGAAETVTYLWNGTSTPAQPSFWAVDTTGNYFVEAVNANGCVAQDTMHVTISGTAPIADFGFQDACLNKAISFTDQSVPIGTDNIVLWSWNLGDGSPVQNTPNVNYTYAASGTYTVQLYVESIGGCGAYSTKTVQVFANPTANFTSTGHCEEQAVQFTNTSTTSGAAITTYYWDFDMPWTGAYNTSAIPVPNRIFDLAGTYDVFFRVTDANGCKDSIVIPLIIDPTPVAEFLPANACANSPLVFTNTSITEPFPTYAWSFGDGSTSILTSPSKGYTNAGQYLVQLVVTNANGCQGTVQHPVQIYPNPIASMQVGPACMGAYMRVTDNSTISSGSIDSSVWVFNTTTTVSGSPAYYLIPALGQQQVVLTTYSNHGCSSTVNQFVQVNSELHASFDVGSNTFAAGGIIVFTNTSTAGSAAFWSFGDGEYSSVFSPEHIYSSTWIDSTLQVYVIAMNTQGCVDTAYQTISVERPTIDLELTTLYAQKQNDYYIIGVKLTNLGTVELTSAKLYMETYKGMLFTETWTGSLAPGQSYIYVFNAQPNVGISESSEEDAFICVNGIGYAANGTAETLLTNNKTCRNLQGERVIMLPIYPNPVSDEMHVQLLVSAESEISVMLYDMNGRIVKEIVPQQTFSIGLHSYTVNMTQVQAGGYYVRMESGEEVINYKLTINN